MDKVDGIVVHQTASPSASSTFSSYQQADANGAHFLIDRDGTIYQTASVFRVTWHVGYLQSRCLITKKCAPAEFKKMFAMERASNHAKKVNAAERKKDFPDRYPNNSDSIGIEIVGNALPIIDKKSGGDSSIFEQVNDKQNDSLKWLIKELTDTLKVSMNEIYRHPNVGRKNETEASTAKW